MNSYTRYLIGALMLALAAVSISAAIAASKPAGVKVGQPAPSTCSSCDMVGMQGNAKSDMPMAQMMQTMHPAIALDGTDVYVVRGNEVIKLGKSGLDVIARTMLPAPPRPANDMSATMGSGPGMKGDKKKPGSMSMMHKPMVEMMPALAVDGSAIYIIRGSEVIKLDKNDLKVLAETTLPHPEHTADAGPMDAMVR